MLTTIGTPEWTGLTAILASLAMLAGARGFRALRRGVAAGDDPDGTLWLVRGIRGGVVAVACAALAAGIGTGATWLVVFGLVFLAEEAYETGVLAAILRHGARAAA